MSGESGVGAPWHLVESGRLEAAGAEAGERLADPRIGELLRAELLLLLVVLKLLAGDLEGGRAAFRVAQLGIEVDELALSYALVAVLAGFAPERDDDVVRAVHAQLARGTELQLASSPESDVSHRWPLALLVALNRVHGRRDAAGALWNRLQARVSDADEPWLAGVRQLAEASWRSG